VYRYIYYYKNDISREVIGYIQADSEDDAWILFAQIKKLDIDSLKTIFNIQRSKS
jgi:hypothetical protein